LICVLPGHDTCCRGKSYNPWKTNKGDHESDEERFILFIIYLFLQDSFRRNFTELHTVKRAITNDLTDVNKTAVFQIVVDRKYRGYPIYHTYMYDLVLTAVDSSVYKFFWRYDRGLNQTETTAVVNGNRDRVTALVNKGHSRLVVLGNCGANILLSE